jgi:hypothetical protein
MRVYFPDVPLPAPEGWIMKRAGYKQPKGKEEVKPTKYTDSHKYPYGYTRANDTDIRKTFDRARAQMTVIPRQPKQEGNK